MYVKKFMNYLRPSKNDLLFLVLCLILPILGLFYKKGQRDGYYQGQMSVYHRAEKYGHGAGFWWGPDLSKEHFQFKGEPMQEAIGDGTPITGETLKEFEAWEAKMKQLQSQGKESGF